MNDMPRIASVSPGDGLHLIVTWKTGQQPAAVDLRGWIGGGGDILQPLVDRTLFETARVGRYGAAVVWGDEDGDLAIDAAHLELIAREQAGGTHKRIARTVG